MATAIEFDHVGKQYRLGLVSTRTLSHDLNRWWTMNIRHKEDPYLKIGETNDRAVKGSSDYVWALRDIDFKVEQGDVVGIIGRNGAGKSTLLKLLSKVTGPSTGAIHARGRIGSLLEVGTGFHPEMTGRENIYMNGAILGMTKHEISRKLDEIVDFSGCERYLDTPVKRYSSGMMVRLGFAVAAHLDPEILVVDEVLAVGDAEFQKKAIGKMKDVSQGEGRTVLFVSHNMGSMQQLCKIGILLDKGQIKYTGSIENTVSEYLREGSIQKEYIITNIEAKAPIQLLEANVKSSDGHAFYPSSRINVHAIFRINEPQRSLVAGFNIYSSYGSPIARCDMNDSQNITSLPIGDYEMEFEIEPLTFAVGRYKIVFDFAEANVKNYVPEESALTFDITADKSHFGNIYNETSQIKTSIIRRPWFRSINKK